MRARRWLAPKLSFIRVEFRVGLSFKKMSYAQHFNGATERVASSSKGYPHQPTRNLEVVCAAAFMPRLVLPAHGRDDQIKQRVG